MLDLLISTKHKKTQAQNKHVQLRLIGMSLVLQVFIYLLLLGEKQSGIKIQTLLTMICLYKLSQKSILSNSEQQFYPIIVETL